MFDQAITDIASWRKEAIGLMALPKLNATQRNRVSSIVSALAEAAISRVGNGAIGSLVGLEVNCLSPEYPNDSRASPDGFIHVTVCAVWDGHTCSCGAADPHHGDAIAVGREGITLPADGVLRTVLLDGVPVTASVRITSAEATLNG